MISEVRSHSYESVFESICLAKILHFYKLSQCGGISPLVQYVIGFVAEFFVVCHLMTSVHWRLLKVRKTYPVLMSSATDPLQIQ
jgi:hypothetical protein